MQYDEVLKRMKSLANPDNVKGMARFGINAERNYGLSTPTLRKIARETGRDHLLSLQLWSSGIRDARILATMIDDPKQITGAQMD